MDTNGPNEPSIIDEDLKIIKVIKTSNAMTWLEQQFQNQRATDEEVFADTKYRVLKEFKQIKKEVNVNPNYNFFSYLAGKYGREE